MFLLNGTAQRLLHTFRYYVGVVVCVTVSLFLFASLASAQTPPPAPTITDTTFIDPEAWYTTTEGSISWDLPSYVTKVALDVDDVSGFEPYTVYEDPISTYIFTEGSLADGVHYFGVQFKDAETWGKVLYRKIQIDTTAPQPFTVAVRSSTVTNKFPVITFEASDETSGIAEYRVSVAGGQPITLTPSEAYLGYALTNFEDGTYVVEVTAYDHAGNTTTARIAVPVAAGWVAGTESNAGTTGKNRFTGKDFFVAMLLVVVVGQFLYLLARHNAYVREIDKLRREADEVEDQMVKTFDVLRAEIYTQILAITKRKRLSKKEEVAVENLNRMLGASETLLGKEVDDVIEILNK
ncbi:hypothetical protein KC727_02985 [Candidatus Kaiserbacteria bacterium]|nr:hypothetical protein [Candidatus Kaiserbacteria bacterium]